MQSLGRTHPTPQASSKASRQSFTERTRGVRILVIDGGGSMGVVAAKVLVELEKTLARELAPGVDNPPPVFLADHFDLICGTSAGGLISLAHGDSRIELTAIHELFESGAVFQTRFGWWSRLWSCLREKGSYSEGPLQEILKKAFPDDDRVLDGGTLGRKFRMVERFGDWEAKRPRIFVVSNPVNSNRMMLFTNYPADEYTRESTLQIGFPYPLASDVHPRQAARATSAAPTYFPPARVNVHPSETILVGEQPFLQDDRWSYFWDGGLVNNSPVLVAITQAQMLFGHSAGIDLIVSVGCGFDESRQGASPAEKVSWFGGFLTTLVGSLKDAITNSEHEYNSAIRSLATDPQLNSLTRERVFRLNPPMPYKRLGIDLDESDPEFLRYLSDKTLEHCQNTDDTGLGKKLVQIARCIARSDSARLADARNIANSPIAEFAQLRADAMLAVKQSPADLISWDSGLLKRARRLRGQDELPEEDERYTILRNSTINFNRLRPIFQKLTGFLATVTAQITPRDWISLKLVESNQLFSDIEAVRYTLARRILYPIVKYGAARGDLLGCLQQLGLEDLLHALKKLIPLEIANCLLVMRMDRSDMSVNPGMPWITRTNSEALRLREVFAECKEMKERDFYTVNETFTNVYTCLKAVVSQMSPQQQVYMLDVEGLLETKVPHWMQFKHPDLFQENQVCDI